MKKVAVIFTSLGPLVNNFKKVLEETLENTEIIRIADDSLIRDVKRNGTINENIRKRTFSHIQSAVDAGADLVVIACSSIGELAKDADEQFEVPIIRIDSAMMTGALETGNRIGVIATLGTTIKPTVDLLVLEAQKLRKTPQIITAVAEGAYEALNDDRSKEHDELILNAAQQMAKDVDVIILAQGSMARAKNLLLEKLVIPVLTSPEACAEAVKAQLNKEEITI